MKVRWFYRLALTTYVAALVAVVLFFPGVSNLWVTIFILVSGFFSLLADYISTKEPDDPDPADNGNRPRLLVIAPTYHEAARWVQDHRDKIGHRRFNIIHEPEQLRGLQDCEFLIVRYPEWLSAWDIQVGRHTLIDARQL